MLPLAPVVYVKAFIRMKLKSLKRLMGQDGLLTQFDPGSSIG